MSQSLADLIGILKRASKTIEDAVEPLCDDQSGFRSLPFSRILPTVEQAHGDVRHALGSINHVIGQLTWLVEEESHEGQE